MSTNLLQHKPGAAGNGDLHLTGLTNMVNSIYTQVRNKNGVSLVAKETSLAMIGLESINDNATIQTLQGVADGLSVALEGIMNDVATHVHKKTSELFNNAQKSAAVAIGMLSADVKGFLHMPIERTDPQKPNTFFLAPSGGDMTYERMKPALEAFDEKDNQNAVTYSVAYNMQAARQDVFGETFFPTVVITPDQVGYGVSIRINNVMQDVRRDISGDLNKFEKKNIIQAVIDPTIFNSDNIKIVPVFRDESEKYFVDSSLMAPRSVKVGDETVLTSALAVGNALSLIGISQTDALLKTGLMDTTDAIDSAVVMRSVVLKVGADVFEYDVTRLPFSTWNKSVQGNYRQLQLNFQTDSIRFTKTKTTVSGGEPTVLTDAIVGDYVINLGFSMFGNINQELGDTEVNASGVRLVSVVGPDQQVLAESDAAYVAIKNALNGAKVIGYTLDAQRTNSNLRQRGQLLDTTFYNQIYAVPLRAPLTILRPSGLGDEYNAVDLASLITATHIKTSNDAVKTLLEAASFLRDYLTNIDTFDTAPKILGVARDLVTPHYRNKTIHLPDVIQSLESLDRFENIQAALVNVIRDYVFRMYRDSGFQAAADALGGGIGQKPTVIIGCDPVIERYLVITGDTRLLGDTFDVKVVSTLNRDMKGKMFITFGYFGNEGVPNPLHFGNMAWKPEMTLALPMLRNGAYTRELTVQPAYLHIVNLPLLLEFNITGIELVATGKVAVPTQEQA